MNNYNCSKLNYFSTETLKIKNKFNYKFFEIGQLFYCFIQVVQNLTFSNEKRQYSLTIGLIMVDIAGIVSLVTFQTKQKNGPIICEAKDNRGTVKNGKLSSIRIKFKPYRVNFCCSESFI